jgi:hypothetical protein
MLNGSKIGHFKLLEMTDSIKQKIHFCTSDIGGGEERMTIYMED